MINAAEECLAWKAEFPDHTGWHFSVGANVIVMTDQGLAETWPVTEYVRDKAFAEARAWLVFRAAEQQRPKAQRAS